MIEIEFPPTLVDLLLFRAKTSEATCRYSFLSDSGGRHELTVVELELRARAIAATISRHCRPGDRALLVYPPGLEFISGFLGCVLAGVLPVPATYPKPRRPMPRLNAIASDCGAALALTTAQTLETLDQARSAPELASMQWLATDQVPITEAADWKQPNIAPDDLAFLQYTSGSTSQPKGVAVSHRNLMHNLAMIRHGFQVEAIHSDEFPPVAVSWLPAYHDMGLVGSVLSTLYSGFRVVMFSPAAFLQRPALWLKTIADERGTMIAAPNFAYELCAAKIPPEERAAFDLRSVRLALCAAEPIRSETVRRFIEAFGPSGFRSEAFYPCYGLAESTLIAAGGVGPAAPIEKTLCATTLARGLAAEPSSAGAPRTQTVIGCGSGLIGQEIAIVDPVTRCRLDRDCVGEIWIAGPSVAKGYWNRPEETNVTFRAEITGEEGRCYLRSGDLGFLSDSQLFVTGRLKDVIIVRGRNYYPQDIEATVWCAHPSLMPDCGAAFSVDRDAEEAVVIVQEVSRHAHPDELDRALVAIRTAVVGEHELNVESIVLIRQASLPRTTSGKVQRSLTRTKYLRDDLKIVAKWKGLDSVQESGMEGIDDRNGHSASVESKTVLAWTRFDGGPDRIPAPTEGLTAAETDRLAERIESRLLEWLTAQAHVAHVEADPAKPFAEYGVDSVAAVELSADLERWLGIKIPAIAAWNYPTSESMARFLADRVAASATPEVSSTDSAIDTGNTEFELLLREVESLSEGEAELLLQSTSGSHQRGETQ